jgi:SAM-dependent methyltransferase
MAPELALEALERAPANAVVLDPMCGSGTVLQHAREHGMRGFGYDIDPLAILVSRVTCTQVDGDYLRRAASRLVADAQARTDSALPWMDSDLPTTAFVDFWFHPQQRDQLRRLAAELLPRHGKVADVLRVALSRTIITKDAGASLARDVSHSRPHRVRDTNDFDVYDGFLRAVRRIAPLVSSPASGNISLARRDARRLPPALRGKVDLVITSPPYLNAIDYMRGHRMSLVWLGYRLDQLRRLRSTSVGAERYPDGAGPPPRAQGQVQSGLSRRQQGMLVRYAQDVHLLMGQLSRVLSDRGEAVLVVGDSMLSGTYISNSAIVQDAAESHGLTLTDQRARPLPTSSRYLPPPALSEGALSQRMRQEVIMRFTRTTTNRLRGHT